MLTVSLFLPLAALAFDPALLPSSFQEAAGKTFAHPGPNCFATALKLTGITASFRGMDEPEFRERVKLQCERTEKPEIGDIGVFEKPGFGFIHAYAFISPEWGMEKPGVDYMGKTPIALASADSIEYRYLASPECRRYSKNISECANDHYFLRCRPIGPESDSRLARHQGKVKKIEATMDFLLGQSDANPADAPLFQELEQEVQKLEADLETIPAGTHTTLFRARVKSLQKQLEFMRAKLTAS